MIVLRIEVHGHRADVRWPGAEAVVGAGETAAIQRDDAGWAPREAVLVHVGEQVLLVRADGSGQVTLRVGDGVRLGAATLTLVGLSPVADGPREVPPAAPPPAEIAAPATGPAAGAPAIVLVASPPDLDDLDVDALASPGREARSAAAPATAPAPRPGVPRERSFDDDLLDMLRRSPWWIASAAAHALAFLLLSLLAPATSPRDRHEVHGIVTASTSHDDPLESGGPEDRLPLDAPPEEVEAPVLDDVPVPEPAELPMPDLTPSEDRDAALPTEDEGPLPTTAIEPTIGPMGAVTRLRIAEKNVVAKKPPPADLDHVNEDAERAREVNQHAAARVRAAIAKGAGPLGRVLKGLRTQDILVVKGSFDKMEVTLEELGLPFTLKAPYDLPGYPLEQHKLVFWNCGESVLRPHEQERVVRAVREFVSAGGYLFTTDWALANLVIPAFPGYLRTRGRIHPLPELILDVVPAEGAAAHRLLEGVFDAGMTPRWWLEQASFDVEIARPDAVEVLAEAPALARQPGGRGTAIALTFTVGRGRVLHVVGHYYQQKGNVSGAMGAQRLPLNFVRMRLDPDAAGPR
ncbi:MAG: hypothetical protein U1E39_15635 [Planctomycetota bacterium]